MAVASDDPRLGDHVIFLDPEQEIPTDADIVILGFPHDEGVRRNKGRVGAAGGPRAFRELYKRMGTVINPEFQVDLRTLKIVDAGDIDEKLPLEEAHEQLTQQVTEILRNGAIPWVIGGGNDQSYANASGLLALYPGDQVGVVNIDAHFDVRPKREGQVHSGSPFRLLLEDPRFSGRFVEFASQGSQCSQEHANYITSYGKRTQIVWLLKDLRANANVNVPNEFESVLNTLGQYQFVSFDLDSVSGADAPGVSCPGTVGLTAEEAVQMCFRAGCSPKVRLFDLSEYNPSIEAYRTGRLVANMFYYFALGVAHRKSM